MTTPVSSTLAGRLVAGAALVRRVDRMLDVGCGDGSLCVMLDGKVRLPVGVEGRLAAGREAHARGARVQLTGEPSACLR